MPPFGIDNSLVRLYVTLILENGHTIQRVRGSGL